MPDRQVLIDTVGTRPHGDGNYRVVYMEGLQEWPYAYDDLDDAVRGIENWLAGRRVEENEKRPRLRIEE